MMIQKKVCVIALLLFFFSIPLLLAETPVAKYGQLQVQGTQLCDQNGQPVALRGISLGWSNDWNAYYNENVVSALAKEWKISLIRAAMSVGADWKVDKDYLKNPEFAESCVEKVVNQAIKEGIYVIIDFHTHHLNTEAASIFFDKMSKKYKGVPNVLYEVFNEPINQSWSEVKAYHESLIDIIRKNDTSNVILCGTPHWDQDIHLAAEDPILNRSNFMYTVHFYAATHKKWLRDRTEKAIRKGLPVFISECAGMEASGDGFLDVEEWKSWVDWLDRQNMSWACWSLTPKKETCSMLIPGTPADGNWTNEQLSPWGKICKQFITERNN